jgi:hypothetical protein
MFEKTQPFPTLTRRRLLQTAGAGFGALGLMGALDQAGLLAAESRPFDVPAKAKQVIFLFMNGAPSHVDTFDPKPMLDKHAGEQPSGDLYRKTKGSGYMPSPFQFAPHGESGVVLSELFPNLARCADDLCLIRSMHTDVPNHEPGLILMHSGHQQPTRPSLGSWCSYGLGSENKNLPAFVVLCPGLPVVGPQLWSNAFLPGEHQGMSVDTNEMEVDKLVANLKHPRWSSDEQQRQRELLNRLNDLHRRQRPHEAALDAQIGALELAFRMQVAASEAFDISREPQSMHELYGDTTFSKSCLLARRLVERGVRFVQVYYISKKNKQPWDTHSDNDNQHRTLCADSDRATAALLTDLKSRGLLDDTLVVWGGEFGRTPFAQEDKKNNKPGRDHHNTGFTMLLAGGGVKGGLMYGATDEFGMNAIENRVHVHDLHATILHQLGIDHERLTYRYSGRDYRLTDVHGRVVGDILA